MLSSAFIAATAILAHAAVVVPPNAPASALHAVAKGVADISTNVCYPLATGELRWTPRNLDEEMAQIKAKGLTYGVPSAVIDAMGPVGQASINRATIASQQFGDYHVILAVNGAIPGCRIVVAGDTHPAVGDLVAEALEKTGWTAVPAFTSKGEHHERRLFLRYQANQIYKLDAGFQSDPSAGVRVLVAVSSQANPNGPPRGTVVPTSASNLRTQQAATPQAEPDVRLVAQAYDRCMATHAVELTTTAAADEEIYARATQSCSPLKLKLEAAIKTQAPLEEAKEVLKKIDARAKPSFMNMLARIRSDRARRGGS